jgi:hypothetical protein
MSVAVSISEIDIEIFHLFWNLFLQTSLLLLYLNYTLVRSPVTLDVLECLFEKERQIFRSIPRYCQTLYVDVSILAWKLLEKDNL